MSLKINIHSERNLARNYTVKSIIGEGVSSEVFEIKDIQMNESYAAKILDLSNEMLNSNNKFKITMVESTSELSILQKVSKEKGFPKLKEVVQTEKNQIIIMGLLGSNLKTLMEKCGGKFSKKTILMIGIQILKRLEVFHDSGYLHGDIQPKNFTIGGDKDNENLIHMIDFGQSCPYLDENNKHIPLSEKEEVFGNFYYLSLYGHLGMQISRRDDIISLGYMLIYMFNAGLPWDNVQASTLEERIEAIYASKLTTSLRDLCKGLPKEFQEYFDYAYLLEFTQKPDYCYLSNIFQKILDNEGLKNDGVFDWSVKNENHSKGIDLNARKPSSESPSTYLKKPNVDEIVVWD